ncbi:MAG TPA: PepSY-associated TM helix domain-containing protein, partial [Methylocella sp.]|nr:PepSY-associated TM helix domain-containing protein [Methylocella sp.]
MGGEMFKNSVTTTPNRTSTQLAFWRALWLKIHRYIGLSLGAIFVISGLTGSILAFWQPIDEWLNNDMMFVAAPTDKSHY